ncbi:histidine kinase [Streptomyces himastatinicus ATCC 53653]|uniref:non-specific serine/threonine protein kinase n=1 Tax=Streptomyces himastatinicus ATCC 53653 TaxID=457427 RepID=D9WEP7_9ACTN|nr:serine/threonine-protein kinase [Streptomyces himastatinicus]EFL25262.1 histidine kinase [Streptomyces himastatinicus ATCC 53653]
MGNSGGITGLLAGRYRLVSRLGRGGMGTVWRAVDELLGRDVAVKELHVDEGSGPDNRLRGERALREARTVAQIKHPNVIVLHDVVEQDDHPWIVMELVDGASLADRLGAQGPLAPHEAGRVAAALLDALWVAHARGVLHRDIKPANVLVEAGTERVVLTDFGIAQVDGATTLTETGAFVGSPEYTAPERMSGRRTGPESDLWSLGVLLCTLVGGASPFHRDSVAGVLHAVVYEDIHIPEAAGPLRPLIEGLLRRDIETRLTADEATRTLRTYLGSGDTSGFRVERTPTQSGTPLAPPAGTQGAPVAPTVPTKRSPRRRTVLMAVAAVVALAGLGAGTMALMDDGGKGTTAHDGGASQVAEKETGKDTNAEPAARESDRTTDSPKASKDPKASTGPTASTSPEPGASPSGGVPEGYELVHDPAGFSLAVPKGFARQDKSPRVYYNSPGLEFRIGIHPQEPDPRGPLAVSREADAQGPSDYQGYRNGQVIQTTQNGHPAALWAFVWDGSADDGGSRQTFDLSWNEGGKMYDLWLSVPVEKKVEGKRYFDTAVATFTRTGG